jgi:hypothetical protein
MEGGREPVNELPWRFRAVTAVSDPMEGGREPVNELP